MLYLRDALSNGRIIQGTHLPKDTNPGDTKSQTDIQGHIVQRYNILSSTTKGPELHYDVSGQVPVLLFLDVSAHVRLRLQNLSEQHEPVLLMDVSKPQVPELHFSVSGQQEPIAAPVIVYTTGSLGMSCTRTYCTSPKGPEQAELHMDVSRQLEPVVV
jgi:hypothetical protein